MAGVYLKRLRHHARRALRLDGQPRFQSRVMNPRSRAPTGFLRNGMCRRQALAQLFLAAQAGSAHILPTLFAQMRIEDDPGRDPFDALFCTIIGRRHRLLALAAGNDHVAAVAVLVDTVVAAAALRTAADLITVKTVAAAVALLSAARHDSEHVARLVLDPSWQLAACVPEKLRDRALRSAVVRRNCCVVRVLLSRVAQDACLNLDACLHLAVSDCTADGAAGVVAQLLGAKADPNTHGAPDRVSITSDRKRYCRTVLAVAARQGNLRVARSLLKAKACADGCCREEAEAEARAHGCKRNSSNNDWMRYSLRPIRAAANHDTTAMCALLLKAKADPRGALHGGGASPACVSFMLRAKTDPNARSGRSGFTPLMALAANWESSDSTARSVTLLLAAKADFHARDWRGFSPLQHAQRIADGTHIPNPVCHVLTRWAAGLRGVDCAAECGADGAGEQEEEGEVEEEEEDEHWTWHETLVVRAEGDEREAEDAASAPPVCKRMRVQRV